MAVPHPDDELARLEKSVARDLAPVTVVTGANDYYRSKAMERVLRAVPKDAELRVLDAAELRADAGGQDGDDDAGPSADAAGDVACAELLELCGGGLFAVRTLLVVRRGAAWWQLHVAALAAAMPRFAAGSALVLEANRLDRRKKVAQNLVKALGDAGSLFEFRDLWDSPFDRSRGPLDGELCKWVVVGARRLGVPLRADAAWLIVMQVGKSLAELDAELQRLRDQFGFDPERKPLAPADLRGRLTCSFESTPFELADALLDGDRRAAWRSLRAMFDHGVKQKDGKLMEAAGLLPFTTSWLYQKLATTLEGRQLLDAGASPRDLPAKVGVRAFADRFVEQVQRHDAAKLRRGLLALHAVQRLSRVAGEEPDVLLERLLVAWFDGAVMPSTEEFGL
jgi:DNA polymerase III delta subunit